ncbi:MAG: discoidin domain-containing protein, partial [Acidobacteria bacterium]|nr:discoidin domain-containing protein [Acidobacteriota bacterium]
MNSNSLKILSAAISILFVFVAISQAQANLALGKPATQSSEFGNNEAPASLAVDGFKDGTFSIGSVTHTSEVDGRGTSNPWWEVDLGQTYELTKIGIHGRTDCCGERLSEFQVLVRNSPNEEWKLVWNNGELKKRRGRTYPRTSFEINLDRNALPSARYLRVQLFGENRILSLAEVEVFGAIVGATPKPKDKCKAEPGPGDALIFERPNFRGECGTFKYRDEESPYPYSVEAKFD